MDGNAAQSSFIQLGEPTGPRHAAAMEALDLLGHQGVVLPALPTLLRRALRQVHLVIHRQTGSRTTERRRHSSRARRRIACSIGMAGSHQDPLRQTSHIQAFRPPDRPPPQRTVHRKGHPDRAGVPVSIRSYLSPCSPLRRILDGTSTQESQTPHTTMSHAWWVTCRVTRIPPSVTQLRRMRARDPLTFAATRAIASSQSTPL